MEKEEFDTVKLGMAVGFVFGPGEFPKHNQGTVTAKVEDRWGFHVNVTKDDKSGISVEEFTDKGIGCYRLDEDGASK